MIARQARGGIRPRLFQNHLQPAAVVRSLSLSQFSDNGLQDKQLTMRALIQSIVAVFAMARARERGRPYAPDFADR